MPQVSRRTELICVTYDHRLLTLDRPAESLRISMDQRLNAEKLAAFQRDFDSKRSLRIAIVTENWLPKVDGVTRTLSRLLHHLRDEGHTCLLMGPVRLLGS